MKKVICMLLVLVLCLGALSACAAKTTQTPAQADESTQATTDAAQSENKAESSGEQPSDNGTVVIPL